MKINSLISAFLLIIACNITEAQSSKGWYDDSRTIPKRNIYRDDFIDTSKRITTRFNFLGLLDPFDENASVGIEYKFASQWSFGMDAACIFNSAYLSDSRHCLGYILRPSVRFYPNKGRRGYFEAELHYKHVSYEFNDWLGKDVVDGVPSYEEYTRFHYIKNAYGFTIRAGTWSNLSKDGKLRMEYYIGLGLRFKKQHTKGGSYFPDTGFFTEIYNPEFTTLVLPMGVRLVYDLKKL